MIHAPSDETIDQIWRDLGEVVSRPRVAEVACEVARDFGDARITAYVPIFVRRATRERLLPEVAVQEGLAAEPASAGAVRHPHPATTWSAERVHGRMRLSRFFAPATRPTGGGMAATARQA